AVAWVANQLLASASIHAGEAEVRCVGRHRAAAFEAAPLGGLAGEIPQDSLVAAYLYLGRAIDDDLNRTFSMIAVTAADDVGAPLGLLLSASPGRERGNYGYKHHQTFHISPQT